MRWCSRQAISPQRPDNYRDCSTTTRPGHKSLRAQYESPRTSLFVGSLLFCLQLEKQLECVSLSLLWASGKIKLLNCAGNTKGKTRLQLLEEVSLLCAVSICFFFFFVWVLNPDLTFNLNRRLLNQQTQPHIQQRHSEGPMQMYEMMATISSKDDIMGFIVTWRSLTQSHSS